MQDSSKIVIIGDRFHNQMCRWTSIMKNRGAENAIAVYGAGGFGLEVAMLIEHINLEKEQWTLIGFFDDKIKAGKTINGYPVLGGLDELNGWKNPLSLTLGLGIPETRKHVFERLANPLITFPTLIHPTVIMGRSDCCEIGHGCIIGAGSILTTNFSIGDHVVINLCCTIGHDATIGSFSALMPSCNISGEVRIGKNTFIGTGTKVINRTLIGDNVVIGAGAVVVDDTPSNVTIVGVPAQVVKSTAVSPKW
jgi:sugar O-acyltransferase (sialic acid O-acetyltransferase NeuD family)